MLSLEVAFALSVFEGREHIFSPPFASAKGEKSRDKPDLGLSVYQLREKQT
jgi:hypothetical protein